uniref:Cyclin N-terminal domain-containing protein n=1 Tax=Nothobranchius furzeri TaxID=105023 RepID=A0A8C6NS81_NOTFU
TASYGFTESAVCSSQQCVLELKLPSYKGQSPQLRFRRYFADLIAVISNHFRFCPAARHLAVYLLDLFMDRYDVTVQQLQVASSACLLLASKLVPVVTLPKPNSQ